MGVPTPFSYLSAILLLLSFTAGAAAEQTPENAGTVPVRMTVSVEGRDGTIPAIAKEDIRVYQGGEPSEVTSWTAVDGRIHLAILVDDSLDPRTGLQIQEIATWVRELPDTMEVMVAYADRGTIRVAHDFTTEHAAAAKALRMPQGTPGAFTSIYDSLQDLMKRWTPDEGTREILLVSDGIDRLHDGLSFYTPELQSTIEMAQREDIVIHTLYARSHAPYGPNNFRAFQGQAALSTMAEYTGGEAYFQGFDTPISFQPYLERLSQVFQNQYTLVFDAKPGSRAGLQSVQVRTELPHVELNASRQVYIPLRAT